VAYSVDVPTVRVNRGVPVTVTDSLKLTMKEGVLAGIYVELDGAVTDERVGAVRSITMVFADFTELGPEDVPVTELAFNCKVKIPSEQLVRVTV
jgi:hypothetical protein